MKIYIAGKLGEEGAIQELMDSFRKAGHEITFDWTKTPHLKPFEENFEASRKCAMDEVRGVKDAEAMVLLYNSKGTGMFVELGVALGNDIPIYAVVENPPVKTSFLYHPMIRILPNIDALKAIFYLNLSLL
jgi:nucleoside 2-deoxyribosyltransferase